MLARVGCWIRQARLHFGGGRLALGSVHSSRRGFLPNALLLAVASCQVQHVLGTPHTGRRLVLALFCTAARMIFSHIDYEADFPGNYTGSRRQ